MLKLYSCITNNNFYGRIREYLRVIVVAGLRTPVQFIGIDSNMDRLCHVNSPMGSGMSFNFPLAQISSIPLDTCAGENKRVSISKPNAFRIPRTPSKTSGRPEIPYFAARRLEVSPFSVRAGFWFGGFEQGRRL